MATQAETPLPAVVIVGCGPAGLTAAIELAKRGIPSLVLEKRSRGDIHNAVVDSSAFGISGKSYAVALRERGLGLLKALSNEAYEAVILASLTNPPTTLWVNGKQRVLNSEGTNVFTTRDTVVIALLSVIESSFAEKITVLYQSKVKRIVTVADAYLVELEGGSPAIPAPVLIGADGVHSAVRRYMVEQGYLTEEVFEDPSPYKVVNITGCDQFRGGMHVFVKRGVGNAIVTPFMDGTMSLTVLPKPGVESSGLDICGEATPERIRSLEDAVKASFPELYSVVIERNKNVFERLLNASTVVGKTVKCSNYHHSRVLLVGDAAHATLPTTGQGLTAAVRSVVHLFEVNGWDGSASSAPAAFERFSSSFKAEGDALFEAGKWVSTNRWSLRYVAFMMTMQKLNALHRMLPAVFSPSLYTSFNTPTISYADAWRAQKLRALALWVACWGVMACVVPTVLLTLDMAHLLVVCAVLMPGLRKPACLLSLGKHTTVLVLSGLAVCDTWQKLYRTCLVAYTLRLMYFTHSRSRQESFARMQEAHSGKMQAIPMRQRVLMLFCLGILYNCYVLPISAPRSSSFGLERIGVVLMLGGGFLQALADHTKSRFKSRNPDVLCEEGVYRFCRHPNYFGEMLFWIGFGIGLLPYDGWLIGIAANIGGKSVIMYQAAKRLEASQRSRYVKDDTGEAAGYFQETPLLVPKLSLLFTSSRERKD